MEHATIRGSHDLIEKPSSEKGRARDRVLNDPELRRVWLASESLGFPFGPMLKLLILTGARRDEVPPTFQNMILRLST